MSDELKLVDLSAFKLKEVLNSIPDKKVIFILAEYNPVCGENPANAILILEKKGFEAKTLDNLLSDRSTLCQEMQNDIYGAYSLKLPPQLNDVKAQVILPASEKHIQKYRYQDIYIIHETPDDYASITLPHIQEKGMSIEWVYNVLDQKAEQDRVLFEDLDPETGFVLAPDFKWDVKDLDSLYCQAICRKRGIKSIRDLTANHLPLLENMLTKSLEVIQEKYGIPSSQIRAYFHYQPSFYHLHIHLVNIKFDAPASGAGKAHLVQEVMDNLRLMPDVYQKKTLTFTLKAGDQLYQKFKDAGRA